MQARHIGMAQRAADEIGEGPERDVAGGMAVFVVDALEVVEVQHQQGALELALRVPRDPLDEI
jgi:hypothetical protein